MSVYPYYKADGNPCLFQVRFDPPHPKAKDGKTFQVWHPVPDGFAAGSPPGLKPLYRPQGTPLDHLKAAEKIVVVEGEKCCEALQAEVGTTSSVTTWPGGSAAWQKANWKPLAGKHVILLADADEPGRKCMVEIAHHLIVRHEGAERRPVWTRCKQKSFSNADDFLRAEHLRPFIYNDLELIDSDQIRLIDWSIAPLQAFLGRVKPAKEEREFENIRGTQGNAGKAGKHTSGSDSPAAAAETNQEYETPHMIADETLCELLRSLGYGRPSA